MSFWNTDTKEKHELIQGLRAEGQTWSEISKILREEYSYAGKAASLRRYWHELNKALEEELEAPVDAILSKYRSRTSANKARREAKELAESLNKRESIVQELDSRIKSTKFKNVSYPVRKLKKGFPMVAEALLSDLQIGKKTVEYNTQVAMRRLQEYGKVLIHKIDQHMGSGYKFDKIIIALMGDMIESAEKATKKNSPFAVDSSTPEQIVNAIEGLYSYVLSPLANLNIPLEVICVPGNHDCRDNGMIMDQAGLVSDSWIIYSMLEKLLSNSKHVNFTITQGMYALADIYGHTAVYEHGYGLTVSEDALLKRQNQRIQQLQKHITYFRMGDKHQITRFNEDARIVNGAFFGMSKDDYGHEYQSAIGFSSRAAQLALFHVPRTDNRLPCYDSVTIQLGHIK